MLRIIPLSCALFIVCVGCTGDIDPIPGAGPDAGPSTGTEPTDPDASPLLPDPDAAPAVPTTTVVLIPGTLISGDFYDTMYERLERDGYRPRVFVPPDMFTESLILGAQRIGAFIDQVIAETGESKVHVIAECDGGVATRYYLQLLDGHEHVDQAITFVSAHNGTVLSPIGEWVTDYQALDDITPGSPFMEEINSAAFPEGLSMTSIYSCWDELLWPQDTSRVPGAKNVEFCDHYIGHFDGFWDLVVYDHMLSTLRGDRADLPDYY
jgi:hypothetical protein